MRLQFTVATLASGQTVEFCYICSLDKEINIDGSVPFGGYGASFISGSGTSVAGKVDVQTGTRIADAAEQIAYSPRWGGAETCVVTVDDISTITNTMEGVAEWIPEGAGRHTLTHTAGDTIYTAYFTVLGEDVETHAGTLTTNEIWSADKVHLITTTVTVPSGVSLTIEPGAVVKFMSGTGLTVSGGGSCIARGAIFTHANDDTVGGDTLCDGDEATAVMGEYTITGSITDDDSTEYRYMPPQTLQSNISSNTRLRGYRTYIASNSVTVASGATLTLQPGTIIKFNNGCSLVVGGKLDAQGSRAAPIVFTSLKDDAHGGDTNGDGDKTYAQAGDWYQIRVQGTANFNYCHVFYNSSTENYGGVEAYGGMVTFDNSEIAFTKYECVNAHSSGRFTARNSVFRESSLGFGYYGGSNVRAYNCVFHGITTAIRQSGKQLVNCVFSECSTAFTDQGGDSSTFRNCVFWNPPGYGPQSYSKVGSNGNVWGDPLFEDVENGDFRIKVNSPCVDAGDGGVAPESDYYGRPRMDNYAASNVGKPNQDGVCPDIGIYEADGRAISPSADLAVLRVDMAHSPTVAPGDTITLTYTITNCGVMAASGTWRDEISLVSPSGRTVVLGENIVPGNIPIGGTLAGTASFTVPAVEEGTWRVRINANAQHDIYEGARTANNVFTSGDGIEVSVVAQSPSEVSGGSLKGGVPHVVKLAFAEGDVNRMVILSLSEGGVASWGFGHVPDAVSKDGTAVTDASGKVSFIVPDGDVAVYIVLESDTTTPWSLTAESPKTSVIGIAPSSGAFGVIVRAVVSGGGFTASNLTVRLVSNGGGIATSATYVNDETIILDIDTGLLAAGEAYDVEVIGEMGMAVLEKAFSVEAPAAKGVLSAKLDLPSSARQGRVAVGYVVCANSGNAEMDVPVFAVSGNVGDIALRGCEATNRGWTNSLWLVGISPSYPKGRLKPGDEVRIPFEFMVNGTYHMELVELDAESPLVRDSIFPSWQKFSAAIASSATVLNGISGSICDYGVLYDYAIKSGYGDDCGIVRGVLIDDVSGAPLAQRTVVAIDPEGVVSDRAVTDASGAFVFSSLVSTNAYIITGAGIESSAVGGVKPENALASEVTLAGHDFATICAVFCENGELVEQDVAVDAVPVLYCENGARWPTDAVFEDGMFRFFGIPDGNYTLAAECGGETFWTAGTNVSVSVAYGKAGDGTVVSVPVERCGRVLFRLEKDGTPAAGVVCHAVSTADGQEGSVGIEVTTSEDGIARFNLKPGSWRFSVSDGYRLVGDGEIDADVLLESETSVSGSVTFVPFTAFPDVGPRPLPVSFSADFLPDSDAVASYAWDFDGDGVTDSTLATPSYTYSTSGKKVVSLSVVYTNGTSAIYSDAAAVDVWDEEFVELETSTLLLDAASGYRVVSRTEDSLVLEYTREAVPADFSDVVTIVIPGEESSPLAVRSWREVDDGIIVETTASSPMRAYRSMRMATVTTLGSNGEMMCSYKDVPIGPWTFSTELCTDGQWRKRGTTQSRMGVALAIEWNTGTIHYLQAVDKDEGGKIVFWESRFKGRWEPEATISGQIEADGQKNRRGRGVRGSPYKPLSVNDQLLALVAGVPICYSAGAEFTATTSLGGEIAIRPAFDVDIGYRYAPDRGGNKPYKTFRSLDDARGLAIRGKGELDLYAGLFAEIYAGANKKAGTKEFGLKVCDITVGGGVAAKASFKVSSDEFEPDEYSFGIYGRFKFDFAPVEVNLGLWKFKPLNVGWHPEKEIIKKELKTPVPTLNISREGRTASGETVAFENKTNYGKWSCSGSGLDNGDREFVNLPKGKKYSHFYSVSPEDTRKCEVVLREKYSFYVGNHPIINPTKANKYSFTVRGSKDPPPPPTKKKDDGGGSVPKSWDPNEMTGPLGSGEARLVKPGDVLTYTVYFENKADAEAAAQEVRVTNPLSEWLDWSTFEMGEVAFNNQIDLGLGGKSGGVSEVTMNGTNFLVRTEVQCDTVRGAVDWYLRIVDPTTETTWPSDILTGFLPPNDDTHRGEGHITYRIKVRDDAPANVMITNSASIVFDYNDPIETDPAWWNTVTPVEESFAVGAYFKATLAELGYDVPTDGKTAYNVVAKGLPAGLQLKYNAAVTKKVKEKGKTKTVVVKPAKVEWWIEGVPTAPLDFMTNPPYLVITVNGETTTEALPIEVSAQEIVDLGELALGQSINTNGWLSGVGAGWTVSGLPTGLSFATKKVTKKVKSGKKTVTVTVAEAYAVYGKTTKAGLFTITAKKKKGTYYETKKFRVFVPPKAVDVATFGEELTNITTMAYVPVSWKLAGGDGVDGNGGVPALPVVPTIAKVAGLPTGLTFAAANVYGYKDAKKKTGKYVKQYGQTIVGTPTKPGTYVVTFTRNVTTGTGKNKKTVAKTSQILWKIVQNEAKLELGFNTSGGVVEGGVVGLNYGDLMAFTATSNATVTASGMPEGIRLSNLGNGQYAFTGFTTKAGTYLVTVKATLKGKTMTQRLALKVEGRPAWAKGTFNGSVKCKMENGELGDEFFGLATVTVSAAGKISGKFYDGGTNWTLSAASYTERADDAFFCTNVVAKYAYKVTKKVKEKGKTVTKTETKYVTRKFTLEVGNEEPWDGVRRGYAVATEQTGEDDVDGVTLLAWQNLWGSTYKDVGKALFSTKSGKTTLAYKTFTMKGTTDEGAELGLDERMTLALKVTTAGAVTATMTFDTGKTVTDKKTKKKTKVYYKPTCQAVVIPATAPDSEEFEGEVYLFFAPSAGNNFPGYVATIPL